MFTSIYTVASIYVFKPFINRGHVLLTNLQSLYLDVLNHFNFWVQLTHVINDQSNHIIGCLGDLLVGSSLTLRIIELYTLELGCSKNLSFDVSNVFDPLSVEMHLESVPAQ